MPHDILDMSLSYLFFWSSDMHFMIIFLTLKIHLFHFFYEWFVAMVEFYHFAYEKHNFRIEMVLLGFPYHSTP